ncbi:hypothetical protein G6N74_10055 [Mesorhizobium sp. CGMCC 1.15528]|uniref:Uncharacterized protein n=1 Tax=Mesorhizobium zhangyense TaxID=1776730 RepID=A0A7C9VC30_9HYPH|nr:hypothetical protein [Mesorhizobium zhangyense]NGN41410.1 hypothetical protein [Mesorhizobium zhangyense]
MLKVFLPLMLTLATSAQATELRHITVRTGTDGLSPVSLTVANAGKEPLACNADIAHWYSVELTAVAPGKAAQIELWFDPKSGTYAALNDKRENLPVERLWCGIEGRAYATRSQIALDHGAAPAALQLTCSDKTGRLVCE